MSTSTPDLVAKALADLQRERDLLDADIIEQQAQAAIREARTKESALDNRLNVIRTAPLTIAALDAKIADEIRWRETLTGIRAQLRQELLALPRVIRDRTTLGLQENLMTSIKSIDFGLTVDRYQLNTLRLGALLKEAGYVEGPKIENQTYGELPWFGDLQSIEKRLATLRQQRAEAEARLAEAMLTDEQRAARLAAINTKNAAPRKKVRADGSVYLKHVDGRIEELES